MASRGPGRRKRYDHIEVKSTKYKEEVWDRWLPKLVEEGKTRVQISRIMKRSLAIVSRHLKRLGLSTDNEENRRKALCKTLVKLGNRSLASYRFSMETSEAYLEGFDGVRTKSELKLVKFMLDGEKSINEIQSLMGVKCRKRMVEKLNSLYKRGILDRERRKVGGKVGASPYYYRLKEQIRRTVELRKLRGKERVNTLRGIGEE